MTNELEKIINILALIILKKKGLVTNLPDGSGTFDKRDLKKINIKLKELICDETIINKGENYGNK